MKYKVGDKVRIVKKWVDGCHENSAGRMNKWLGQVMTIRDVEDDTYLMEEDKAEFFGGWRWFENSIAGLADDKKIVITTNGKETIARLYDGNKVIRNAIAKCSPDDEFVFNIGAKLAFERLMGVDEGEWRVVHRPAKVGDYIRITNPSYGFNRVGDILKVYEMHGCVGVLGRNHPRNTGDDRFMWHYGMNDYEVVERVGEKKVEEPKYYSGKVVCVECEDDSYTVGKVYEFKDGTLVDNHGHVIYGTCRVKHPSEIVDIYKFIPYVE